MKQYLSFIFLLFSISLGFSQVQQGIAVDPNTYTPNHTVNKAVPIAINKDNGKVLIDLSSRFSAIEVASAARTASGNSGAITSPIVSSISASIRITAVSGTNPTLDLALEESFDGGVTFIPIWHFERVTAISNIYMPPIPSAGQRRWTWTIAGTTPSFTFSIASNSSNASFPLTKQFFDRTAGLLNGTLNATSSSYMVSGVKDLSVSITLGAATTPASYQIQVSSDGVNWVPASIVTPAVAAASMVIARTSGISGRFVRLICTSAGTAQTGTLISFAGVN